MEGNDMIFYTPEKQYPGMPHGEMCGDFMPFYWQGIYYLFYLYKYCVYVVETKDFVHFGKPYLALQNGSPEEQDWHIGTGSMFHHEGTFYFHYTGFCEGNDKESGKYQQVVMRAVSKDLKTWEKDKQFFFPPQTTLKPPCFSCGNLDYTGACEVLTEKWSCVSAEYKMDKFPRKWGWGNAG